MISPSDEAKSIFSFSGLGGMFPGSTRCCLCCYQTSLLVIRHHSLLPKAPGGGGWASLPGVRSLVNSLLEFIVVVMDGKDGDHLVGHSRLGWIFLDQPHPGKGRSCTQRCPGCPTNIPGPVAPGAVLHPLLGCWKCLCWMQGWDLGAALGLQCPRNARLCFAQGLYSTGIYLPSIFSPVGIMSSTAFSSPQLPVGIGLLYTEESCSHNQFLSLLLLSFYCMMESLCCFNITQCLSS